jgi:predicted transport protein
MVRNCSKEIFGNDSLYFDVRHVLRTASGIGSIPDAYVISLSRKEWYVVENELASHPIYDHIIKQLTKFINGIRNQNARTQIIDMLYKEINKDPVLKATMQKHIGSTDIYHFLSKLVSKSPRIVIIIDQKTSDIEEACRVLKYQPDIVEFKTYVRENAENVHTHLFEPLYAMEKISERKEELRRPLPEHYENWENMLAWVNDNVKEIVEILTNRIIGIGNVNHVAHGRYYCFYKGKPSTKSIFAAFLLTKAALKVRIRTVPNAFKDPKKWTGDRVYKGWFFKQGQEREFKITGKDQIDYAMELIKQSCQLAEQL